MNSTNWCSYLLPKQCSSLSITKHCYTERMNSVVDLQCTSSFQVSSSVDSGSPMTPDLQTSLAAASLTEGTKERVLRVTLPSGEDL